MSLLLLPGLDGTAILFGPLREALPPAFRVETVEYPPDAVDYDALLPIVRAACGRLDDCVVLGWSFSGPLAILLAAAPPPYLRGVVLAATFASSPWPLGRWLAPLVRSPIAALAPLGSRALGTASGELGARLRRDQRAAWARLRPATLAGRVRSVLRVDVRQELAACRLPVLAFASERDLVVPGWNARRLQRLLPAIETAPLPGGHLALHTAAPLAAARLAAFAARAVTGAAP
jgi:pimeloyl-ACP methyl ester carboxylesterase